MMRDLWALLLYGLLQVLRLTWRVRVEGRPPAAKAAALLVFWHGDLIALLGLPRRVMRGVTVMVSRSRDGDFAARLARHFALRCSRGSSSTGAVPATLALVRRLRSGGRVALAADGPRGPRLHAGAGLRRLALLGQTKEVIPLAARAGCALTLRSWDALAIPLPFSRVQIVWGERNACEIQAGLLQVRARAIEGLRG